MKQYDESLSFLQRYERFVMSNSRTILMSDGVARLVLLFFLREKTLLHCQASYTILDLFSWINSVLLVRRGYDRKRLLHDSRFNKRYKVGQAIQFIRNSQLFIEMLVYKYKPEKRYDIVIVIEAIKFVMKYSSSLSNSPPIFVNPQNLPREEVLVQEIMPPQPAPQRNPSQFVMRHPTDMLLAPFIDGHTHILLKFGELLYNIRPLIYACLLAKYGTKTWYPWIVTLMFDIMSMLISRYAIRSTQYDMGVIIDDEIESRRPSVTNYLFKSPVFDQTLLPAFEKFMSTMGWAGGLVSYWMRYSISMQKYFYYTEN
jgi:hypothetical protein